MRYTSITTKLALLANELLLGMTQKEIKSLKIKEMKVMRKLLPITEMRDVVNLLT